MRSGVRYSVVVLGLSAWVWAADAQPRVEQPKVVSVKSQVKPLAYSNPAAKLEGDLRPSSGSRLVLVELVLGTTAVKGDAATLKLVAKGGETYAPIALGGAAAEIVPLDKLEIGQNVGMVQQGGAMFLLTKTRDGVTVSVDQKGALALVYEMPTAAEARQVKIGGLSIPLQK